MQFTENQEIQSSLNFKDLIFAAAKQQTHYHVGLSISEQQFMSVYGSFLEYPNIIGWVETATRLAG